MGLGRREARHQTVAAAKIAGTDPSIYWEFRPGQAVMTRDGYPGKVVAVNDGPFAGNEEYEVVLDHGMGGGAYTASLLRPIHQVEANVDVKTAADDYPELGTILEDRPPLALSVASSKTAERDVWDERPSVEHGCAHVYCDQPAVPGARACAHHMSVMRNEEAWSKNAKTAKAVNAETHTFQDGACRNCGMDQPDPHDDWVPKCDTVNESFDHEGSKKTAVSDEVLNDIERNDPAGMAGRKPNVNDHFKHREWAIKTHGPEAWERYTDNTGWGHQPGDEPYHVESAKTAERFSEVIPDNEHECAECGGGHKTEDHARATNCQTCYGDGCLDCGGTGSIEHTDGSSPWTRTAAYNEGDPDKYTADHTCPKCGSDRALESVTGVTKCEDCGYADDNGADGYSKTAGKTWPDDGEEHELHINGHGPYQVRYDSEQAYGDSGAPARGFTTGHYTVTTPDGQTKSFRHTPHGPGLSGAKGYAQDQAMDFMKGHARAAKTAGLVVAAGVCIACGDPRKDTSRYIPGDHPEQKWAQVKAGTSMCKECAAKLRLTSHFDWAKTASADDPFDMLVVAAVDSDFRFHVTASFADVRAKAKRLREAGNVNIISATAGTIAGNVRGDHAIYETVLSRQPGKQAVAQWGCGCKWAAYNWGRTGNYKRFEGRMCSHALALQYEAQSRGMFGRQVEEDQKAPSWLKARTRVVTEYDKDSGKNISRPAQPRKRDLERTYAALGSEIAPVAVLCLVASQQGVGFDEMTVALESAGINAQAFITTAGLPSSDQDKRLHRHKGDQTPCARAGCGHPDGIHGDNKATCLSQGCDCKKFTTSTTDNGQTAATDEGSHLFKSKESRRHTKHHTHHGHGHLTHPHMRGGGGEYPMRGGWGYGYGYLPYYADYAGGSSGAGGGDADDGGGGGDSDGGGAGGGAGATASLKVAFYDTMDPTYTEGNDVRQNPNGNGLWNATSPPDHSANPASTGWAATGDPDTFGDAAVNDVGGRLGFLLNSGLFDGLGRTHAGAAEQWWPDDDRPVRNQPRPNHLRPVPNTGPGTATPKPAGPGARPNLRAVPNAAPDALPKTPPKPVGPAKPNLQLVKQPPKANPWGRMIPKKLPTNIPKKAPVGGVPLMGLQLGWETGKQLRKVVPGVPDEGGIKDAPDALRGAWDWASGKASENDRKAEENDKAAQEAIEQGRLRRLAPEQPGIEPTVRPVTHGNGPDGLAQPATKPLVPHLAPPVAPAAPPARPNRLSHETVAPPAPAAISQPARSVAPAPKTEPKTEEKKPDPKPRGRLPRIPGLSWWHPDYYRESDTLINQQTIRPQSALDVIAAAAEESRRAIAELHDIPEPALPTTDGAQDPDAEIDPDGDIEGMQSQGVLEGVETVEDIVAQFQATAGARAIQSGSSSPGSVQEDDVAAAAKAFLQTEAMKSFSPAEQRQIIDEGKDVQASNLDRLKIEGTHYEALEAALASATDDDDLDW